MVSFEIKNASGTILIYEINLTTSTITVDPHRLEVKGTLTKNYCISVSTQKPAPFINSLLRYNRF